jgi:hypothetical protein
MGAPFRDARLKIERANKHIADLELAISALEEANIATVQEDTNTRTEIVKHDNPGLADGLLKLSLIAGDAIHNLRVALDYAWASAIERYVPTAISGHNKFPVRDNRTDVEAALHGIEVDTKCPALFKAVVFEIQPYNCGNRLIYALHDLDISDKHLLLLELSPITGIRNISISDDQGNVYEGISLHTEPHKPYVIRTKPGLKFENKGKFSLNVAIKEAGVFKGVPIFDLLNSFRDFVFDSVQLLENL